MAANNGERIPGIIELGRQDRTPVQRAFDKLAGLTLLARGIRRRQELKWRQESDRDQKLQDERELQTYYDLLIDYPQLGDPRADLYIGDEQFVELGQKIARSATSALFVSKGDYVARARPNAFGDKLTGKVNYGDKAERESTTIIDQMERHLLAEPAFNRDRIYNNDLLILITNTGTTSTIEGLGKIGSWYVHPIAFKLTDVPYDITRQFIDKVSDPDLATSVLDGMAYSIFANPNPEDRLPEQSRLQRMPGDENLCKAISDSWGANAKRSSSKYYNPLQGICNAVLIHQK